MELTKQNTSGLYLQIQKIGCFFMCCLNVAQWISGKKLKIKEINYLWDLCVDFGYIDNNLNIKDSAKIINKALEYLKNSKRVVEVATFASGVMSWYKSVPEEDRRADFYIQKIKQNGPSKTHFINVDKYGVVLEDPHNPPINKIDVYYTICYRLDTRK